MLNQLVFGINERDGPVRPGLITDCPAKTLQAVIRGKVFPESLIRSGGWKGYGGLPDVENIFASANSGALRKSRFLPAAFSLSEA